MLNLKDFIRTIPNFPKAGIEFKDITPLLNNYQATNHALNQLVQLLNSEKIDKVVGIESRGFLFGTLLAQILNAGFVPVRKKGKLPFNSKKAYYKSEYGDDFLEIHADAIKPGERILLHDDVLATGGTASSAAELINVLGGKIVQCNFLIELSFLEGKQKLSNYNIKSVIQY